MATGYRLPQQQSIQDTMKFLTWEQFPAILEKSIEYFAVLPQMGTYRHVNPTVRDFKDALLDTTGRQFTISGVGSLIDYDRFGHQIKRPVPQLQGGACSGNSLCLEPTCFGFTEGVIESNNVLQDMCWSLSMPCLKDMLYSDMQFDRKMKQWFGMFFAQAPAVLQAYQRTRLIRESIKVVATAQSYRFSGPVIGGSNGLPLPFYIDPVDAISFPNVTGIDIGGFNIMAFMNFVAPRLFTGSFGDGMEGITVYGLKGDLAVAKEQTASAMDHYMDLELLRAMQMRGVSSGNQIDSLLGDFVHDSMFPTFQIDAGGTIVPITQEILEPSTIAGYVQTANPEHTLSDLRALLLVPDNWMFDLVEPPKDDFSYLGLGEGLNFRTNSPGNFPVLSSSMFSMNRIGPDGVVVLGQQVGRNGQITQGASGLQAREKAIREAVRTELLMTYSSIACGAEGQLPNVGPATVPQGAADGFRLKSTMYVSTAVRGTAKPVLVIFRIDQPRSAKPIVVCNVVEVEVNTSVGDNTIVNCCPGNQIYAVLTFRDPVGSDFVVGNDVAYRTGPKGSTFLAEVTSVAGNTVVIQSSDAETLLPCCAGAKDDYGTQGELLNITLATATSSEIMKAQCVPGTPDTLLLEFFDALDAALIAAAATITLDDGSVINVVLSAAASGVSATVEAAVGETCDLCALDCACLINAVFSYTV